MESKHSLLASAPTGIESIYRCSMMEVGDGMEALRGTQVPSSLARGVVYRIDRPLGVGGMSVALFALRVAPEGQTPVVFKILKPSFVAEAGPTASMIVQKEAVALGRLNERVPATPFVVRLIDTGSLRARVRRRDLDIPWLALEYVHGGAEGTTLTERVAYAISSTGHAFDLPRAALAIDCLTKGMHAVHEVGVVHRDIKPDNILCCGFGDSEVFKVADFGLARPSGVAATFGGLIVGTPGYAPPELLSLDASRIGPWSDIFSCASVAFFVLTGEDYFQGDSVAELLSRARGTERRSIRECPALSPELAERPDACRAMDAALARATSPKGSDRPQTASELASSIIPWLRADSRRTRAQPSRVDSIVGDDATRLAGWSWLVRWNPGADIVVRRAAWDSDGTCLAATNRGLAFWTGTEWREAPGHDLVNTQHLRFVRRVAPAQWLVGGDAGALAVYTSDGISEHIRPPNAESAFDFYDGDLDDLAVLCGTRRGGQPVLHALVGRRWIRPLALKEASAVTALARVDDETWLITGRGTDRRAFAALYAPLALEIRRLDTPPVRALLACAGHADRRVGMAVGAASTVLWRDRSVMSQERVDDHEYDLSAAAVDVAGRGWVASAGRIWLRQGSRWSCTWADETWTAPIVSLFADVGVVLGMTADGGIVEGRVAFLDLEKTLQRRAFRGA